MSDLISRSEVNDVIDELEVYTYGKPNTMKVEVSVLQLKRFINKLKNIQNAYSVDKVVDELDGAMWLTTNDDGETNNLSIQVVSFEDAIEIVKHGGVGKEVD